MDREKAKLIIRNLELLIDALKAEVYSDTQSNRFEDIKSKYLDYDEIFEEDND